MESEQNSNQQNTEKQSREDSKSKRTHWIIIGSIIISIFVIGGAGAYSLFLIEDNSQQYSSKSQELESSSDKNEHFFGTLGGDSGTETFEDVQPTSDGGYVAVGQSENYSPEGKNGYVAKIASDGTEEWTKIVGGKEWEKLYSVQRTSNGGYIIVGGSFSHGYYNAKGYIIKINANGSEEWTRTFGGNEWDIFRGVTRRADGGIVVVGASKSYSDQYKKGFIVKISSQGEEKWSKVIGSTNRDEIFHDVHSTLDGGYLAVGTSKSQDKKQRKGYLVKLTSDGRKEWTRTLGGEKKNIIFYSVQQTREDEVIIVGKSRDDTDEYHQSDGYILKMSLEGRKKWARTFGGEEDDEIFQSIQVTSDESYLVGGRSDHLGVFVKISSEGNTEWTKTINAPNPHKHQHRKTSVQSIRRISDQKYVAVGYGTHYGGSDQDGLILTFNSKSKDISGCNTLTNSSQSLDKSSYKINKTSSKMTEVSQSAQSIQQDIKTITQRVNTVCTTRDDTSQIANEEKADFFVGTLDFSVRNVARASENGFVTGGDKLVKMDNLGSVESTIDLPSTIQNIHQTLDGGYVLIAGNQRGVYSSPEDKNEEYILKLDSNNNIEWRQTLKITQGSNLHEVVQIKNGGYLVGGTLNEDGYLLKLTKEGKKAWRKTFGGENLDTFQSIHQNKQGEFIAVGKTASYGGDDYDGYVVKLTSSGKKKWTKIWGDSLDNTFKEVISTSKEDGYIIVGGAFGYTGSDKDALIMNISKKGDKRWARTVGDNRKNVFQSVEHTSDDGYIATGQRSGDGYIVKMDATGKEEWTKIVGGIERDTFYDIHRISNNQYIFVGTSRSYLNQNTVSSDGYIMKLNIDKRNQFVCSSYRNVSSQRSENIDIFGQKISQEMKPISKNLQQDGYDTEDIVRQSVKANFKFICPN